MLNLKSFGNVPKVVEKMEKIGRAFIALWLPAQKVNELGIAEPVVPAAFNAVNAYSYSGKQTKQ
jgi:hypothetical protein